MTDNEIIKTLSICSNKTNLAPCPAECPMYQYDGDCFGLVQKDMLDLINRQKAEIERLQANNSSMQSTLAKMSMGVEKSKAEAIKAFAERLKEAYPNKYVVWGGGAKSMCFCQFVDNLVKEMVGADNG